MKVWVVMGNSYPSAVFDSQVEAEAYCEVKRRQERVRRREQHWTPCIHWRSYEFELQEGE